MNSSLALNHGGAATALANAAGPNLVRELERIAMDKEYNASAGEIFSTTGGHLACREVYHVVPSEYDFQKSGPATKVLKTSLFLPVLLHESPTWFNKYFEKLLHSLFDL